MVSQCNVSSQTLEFQLEKYIFCPVRISNENIFGIICEDLKFSTFPRVLMYRNIFNYGFEREI